MQHDPLDDLLAIHDAYEPPAGHKAEVIGGIFTLSPSPVRRHGFICSRLHRQLDQLVPSNLMVTSNVTVDLTATRERYIPDLLVVDELVMDTEEWLLPPAHAEMVVEVVSPSNARTDRVTKVRGYATSGVPIYLLVDPLERVCTLFTEPSGTSYQLAPCVEFGKQIALPEPFTGAIDTAVFG